MSSKPIEGMTAISIDERMDLFREELKGVFARVLLQRNIDGVPGLEEIMGKFFPELFAEPLVPGKGSLIKAGEVFILSCAPDPDYEAVTYVAKKDFDLKVEYEKQLQLNREELEKKRGAPLGNLYPGHHHCEIAQFDMSRRLREEGVIEVFQCRVHHLNLSGDRSLEEEIHAFYESRWVTATGERVKLSE